MKCPVCGSENVAVSSSGGVCMECHVKWERCQHEPANFSGEPANVVYRTPIPGPPAQNLINTSNHIDIRLPYHVCRLCGVFYTDIDAIREGEKKYEKAQRSE